MVQHSAPASSPAWAAEVEGARLDRRDGGGGVGQNQVDGLGNSVATHWTFGNDATVTRQVITTPAGGSPDQVTSTGDWEASGGTLTVAFSAPDSSSQQYGYTVTGDTLTLNGLPYVRGQ
jgi:hypothetical protein